MNTVELANYFKALSEPVRLRILNLLRIKGELCVCDIESNLELPQSLVSRHLAHLRNSQLVTSRREGIWMHYQLNEHLPLAAQTLQLLESATEHIEELHQDGQKSQTHCC